MRRSVLVLLAVVAASGESRASAAAPIGGAIDKPIDRPISPDDTWRVTSSRPLTVDADLALATPTALSTGLSTGAAAGVSFGGGLFAVGARVSWSTATESSIAWAVTQADVRLRVGATIQHAAGRARMGLRILLGPSVVHETRTRNQGQRAGLTGTDLETSAWAVRPATDVEVVIALHVAGPWLMLLSGGPSLSMTAGTVQAGWIGQLGVGWQP